MSPPPLLAVRRLEYAYPGGIVALHGLDLTIERGRKLAILGPNGSGKTTLLLHLNGTLRPGGGEILLDGRAVAYDRRVLDQWRRRVGLVLQDPEDQLFAATVGQDVSFGPLNLGLSEAEARQRVGEALTALDIASLADRATHNLSFGQKKRAAIAGILAMRPEILVLDEPTAGLDPQGVNQLLEALQQLHEAGTTLVFSTHDVELAYGWADQVAVFHDGTVLAQGDPDAVLGDRTLLRQAHLQPPLLLELAQLLEAGQGEPGRPQPRSREALLARLRERLRDRSA
ncbi:MAG TPA: ABC transporter ATP-binding protein [Candidatus Competibacteraceae bacterium]|nr:ABC transporter ATP-binding protein [Candidatus Competibacteraceae bacterium]HQA26175.1 ABC transporter ATP-binding protein [Candidatus Competibacteraceae bacterium]HQD57022.1 ABC transporter ATP-binding protein [Candidatus Competibacteraceae bacterium]